jgi:hypothetical protein
MAGFPGQNEDKVLTRWWELIAANATGTSATSVRAALADLHSLIIWSTSAAGESAAGELQAALGERPPPRAATVIRKEELTRERLDFAIRRLGRSTV